MKSVSGNIVSSKPVSLSKASKILSNFVSFETGASQAVSVYLRRAAAAFAELNHFHKDLNSSSASHKTDKDSELFVYGGAEIDDDVRNRDLEKETKKEKKKKKKKKKKGDDVEVDSGSSLGIELEKSKEKKKRKSMEIDEEAAVDLAEQSGEKKKKKKRRKMEGN